MVRCYLVHDRVEAFGLQAINALYPPLPGSPVEAAPRPTKRTYYSPNLPNYHSLKQQLEDEWVPAMQRRIGIETHSLPGCPRRGGVRAFADGMMSCKGKAPPPERVFPRRW